MDEYRAPPPTFAPWDALPMEIVYKQRDITEKEVWLTVCAAVARSEGAKDSHVPVEWANNAANAFVKRFGGSK